MNLAIKISTGDLLRIKDAAKVNYIDNKFKYANSDANVARAWVEAVVEGLELCGGQTIAIEWSDISKYTGSDHE